VTRRQQELYIPRMVRNNYLTGVMIVNRGQTNDAIFHDAKNTPLQRNQQIGIQYHLLTQIGYLWQTPQ